MDKPWIFVLAMSYLIILTLFFGYMMMSIIKVQAVNFWTGMTTNERFSR
jgi:hypothetical protein